MSYTLHDVTTRRRRQWSSTSTDAHCATRYSKPNTRTTRTAPAPCHEPKITAEPGRTPWSSRDHLHHPARVILACSATRQNVPRLLPSQGRPASGLVTEGSPTPPVALGVRRRGSHALLLAYQDGKAFSSGGDGHLLARHSPSPTPRSTPWPPRTKFPRGGGIPGRSLATTQTSFAASSGTYGSPNMVLNYESAIR